MDAPPGVIATGAPRPLQVSAVGAPVAVAGTALLTLAFVAVTAHLAARYVLGDVSMKRAGIAAPLPAAVILVGGLTGLPPLAWILLFAATDLAAISAVYRLRWRTAAVVAVVHYALVVSGGIATANVVRWLGSAPV